MLLKIWIDNFISILSENRSIIVIFTVVILIVFRSDFNNRVECSQCNQLLKSIYKSGLFWNLHTFFLSTSIFRFLNKFTKFILPLFFFSESFTLKNEFNVLPDEFLYRFKNISFFWMFREVALEISDDVLCLNVMLLSSMHYYWSVCGRTFFYF